MISTFFFLSTHNARTGDGFRHDTSSPKLVHWRNLIINCQQGTTLGGVRPIQIWEKWDTFFIHFYWGSSFLFHSHLLLVYVLLLLSFLNFYNLVGFRQWLNRLSKWELCWKLIRRCVVFYLLLKMTWAMSFCTVWF